jgi:hypothetical protein
MDFPRLLPFALAAAIAPLAAQSIRVYSEFQRLDPKGAVLAVDKAPRPREILSPALIRNAYASFQVAVETPKDVPYSLYLGQNPEGAVKPAVYKVGWERRGAAWWPDRLTPLGVNAEGRVADAGARLPGQTADVFLLDLWVPPAAKVERVRLEIQLNVGEDWIIYPTELRILAPVLPFGLAPGAALAAVEPAADTTARNMLQAYLCGGGKREPEGPPSLRSLIRRNAGQDAALARSLEKKCGKDGVSGGLLALLAPGTQLEAWCQAPVYPSGQGAEAYLRVRDYLYRLAERGCAAEPGTKVTITVTPLPK